MSASVDLEEWPEGTPAPEVMKYWLAAAEAEDAVHGEEWPTITPEQMLEAGLAWSIFSKVTTSHRVLDEYMAIGAPRWVDRPSEQPVMATDRQNSLSVHRDRRTCPSPPMNIVLGRGRSVDEMPYR